MIWTSYYAKYKGNAGICISNSHPDNIRFHREIKKLFPSWKIVKDYKFGVISWKEFRKLYIQQLKKLDVHEFAKQCDGHVLLCWEKDDRYCHRSILREWFNRNGYSCEELEANTTMGTCLWCKNFKGSSEGRKFIEAKCTKTKENLSLEQIQCHTCTDWRYIN